MEFTYTEPVDSLSFIGRSAVIVELESRLSSTVLIGEARIGKSSVLRHLKYRLAKLDDRSRRQIPISVNLRSPVLLSQAHFYRAISTSLITDESIPRSVTRKIKPESVDSSTSFLNVLELLAINSVRIVPVLLVDNLDQPQSFLPERLEFYYGLRQLIDFAPEAMPLKIVASATPGFLTLEPSVVSRLISRLRQSYLGSFSDNEVSELAGRTTVFTQCQNYDVILKYLMEQSGGHPCLLQELIVKTLERRLPNEPVLHRLELEALEISERGGSFFQNYVKDLSYEELLHLLPIAFGSPSSEWQIPQSSIKRFSSAGLIRETPNSGVDPSCTLFFRWFMQNVGSVMPHLRVVERHMLSVEEFVAWFQKAVRTALASFPIRSEKDLSGIVQGVLAGGSIEFEREAPIEFKTKQYRIDMAVHRLHLAVELKFVADPSRLGHIIDQIEVDALAYLSIFKHLVAVIVAPSVSTRLGNYAHAARNPFIHFIIVETDK